VPRAVKRVYQQPAHVEVSEPMPIHLATGAARILSRDEIEAAYPGIPVKRVAGPARDVRKEAEARRAVKKAPGPR